MSFYRASRDLSSRAAVSYCRLSTESTGGMSQNCRGCMGLSFRRAMAEDVAALVKLHTATAEALTQRHGQGPWSGRTTDKGVLFGMRTSTVFVACDGPEIVGTLRLATKKPWAIDPKYFAAVPRPL